jgi:hypothetical protein
MMFSEFEEIAKRAFVYAATRDFGINRKKANVSRVIGLTGISRREVRKHLNAGEIGLVMGDPDIHPAASIPTRWDQGDDSEIIKRFGLRLRDLGTTIDYNASSPSDRVRNFEATAYSLRLSNESLTAISAGCRGSGSKLPRADRFVVEIP